MSRAPSAGVLLYRRRHGALEVLLVHPGGPLWARRDDGAWSIPKGEFDPAEPPEAAARREFLEETGTAIDAPLYALPPARQASGKVVHAFAAEGDIDADAIVSNTFEMEWPPRSGTLHAFPEVDRAGWFDLDTAATKVVPGQRPLLEALRAWIMAPPAPR